MTSQLDDHADHQLLCTQERANDILELDSKITHNVVFLFSLIFLYWYWKRKTGKNKRWGSVRISQVILQKTLPCLCQSQKEGKKLK